MSKKKKIKQANKVKSKFLDALSTKIVYLNTLLITVVLFFFLYLGWQVFFKEIRNSLELFPESSTAFATELNLGDETFENAHFRNWLLENTFGETILSHLNKDELSFLLNKKYSLGIANIDGSWIVALKPAKAQEKIFNAFLQKNKLKIENFKIYPFKIAEEELFISVINNYFLVTKDKNILYKIYETKNKKLPNVAHTERLFLLPKKNFFKLNNLIFINPNSALRQVTSNLSLNSDIELENIITHESDLSQNLFGTFEVTNKNINFNLLNLPLNSFDQEKNEKIKQPLKQESTLACKDTNLISISGTNFKTKWIDLQKNFEKNGYISLQKLIYFFISDLKEKTEFDLEENLFFQINKNYCFAVDIKKNGDLIYNLVLEKDQNINTENFIKDIETAFIRFAPFTKPKLRNYTLEDGTKASEWIIETETLTNKNTTNYQGIKVFETKLLEEYSTSLNYAYLNNLILISSDSTNLKAMIDYYKVETEKTNKKETLTLIPENLSPILNPILSSDEEEKRAYFNKLILPIKKIEVNQPEDYLYNVDFYY